jgi:hypothetical protein
VIFHLFYGHTANQHTINIQYSFLRAGQREEPPNRPPVAHGVANYLQNSVPVRGLADIPVFFAESSLT